jgi:succinate dehydrogenase hydrophobic anchor subunit
MRTPDGRSRRGSDSAQEGHRPFHRSRVTSVALLILSFGFVIIVIALQGATHGRSG